MSTAIFGENLDIHAGGIDLAFPHHENEIAQCQGHSGKQWSNYFLHTGHLNIDGLKMSKSLKNFLTISDILKISSPESLRILFLQHSWNKDMSYDKEQLKHADAIGKKLFNFMSNAESVIKKCDKRSLNEFDGKVLKDLDSYKNAVHVHLANNLNTSKALEQILALISATNVSINALHTDVLKNIYNFVLRIMGLFGIRRAAQQAAGNEEAIAELLNRYRSDVRKATKAKDAPSVFFKLSDKLREDIKQYNFLIDDKETESIIRRV